MTTDAFPKVRSAAAGRGRIVGIAKGAGMIEPNMATLLCFLCTDVAVPRERLREDLAWCVERTLNRLSIDGDQSTSDTAILLSSGLKGPADAGVFRAALLEVLSGLAFDIVPGKPDASILIYRVSATEPATKLPELGRNLVYDEGVALLRDWITQMPGTCN